MAEDQWEKSRRWRSAPPGGWVLPENAVAAKADRQRMRQADQRKVRKRTIPKPQPAAVTAPPCAGVPAQRPDLFDARGAA